MKKFFALFLTILALMVTARAQDYTTVVDTAVSNAASDIQGFVFLKSLTVVNGSALTTCEVELFDAPSTSLTYSSPGWTNAIYSNTVVSVVTTLTNLFTGNTFTQTNSTLQLTVVKVAAATSNYVGRVKLAVPAGSSATFTPTAGITFNYGVLRTNLMPLSIMYDYRKMR